MLDSDRPAPAYDMQTILKDFPAEIPPKSLFHFFRDGGDCDPVTNTRAHVGLEALQHGWLNLTPPKYFNDPFEMWAGIDAEALTADDMVRSLTAEKGLFVQSIRVQRPKAFQDFAAHVRTMTAAVREKPELWPKHLATSVEAIHNTATRLMGISCFSSFTEAELNSPLGIRHWSVYGENHCGYVIEYDGEHEFFKQWAAHKLLFEVKYQADRFIVPLKEFDEWTDEKMWQTLRRWSAFKSSLAWAHEKEWRIMLPIGEGGEKEPLVMHFKNAAGIKRQYLQLWPDGASNELKAERALAIRRVILGANSSSPLKDAILAAVGEPHFKHVTVWKASPCLKEYALLLARIK